MKDLDEYMLVLICFDGLEENQWGKEAHEKTDTVDEATIAFVEVHFDGVGGSRHW